MVLLYKLFGDRYQDCDVFGVGNREWEIDMEEFKVES